MQQTAFVRKQNQFFCFSMWGNTFHPNNCNWMVYLLHEMVEDMVSLSYEHFYYISKFFSSMKLLLTDILKGGFMSKIEN